jgi:hypothetical protein
MNQCAKCGLFLPSSCLIPVILKNNKGQQKQGYLCNNCRTQIDIQQKGKPSEPVN